MDYADFHARYTKGEDQACWVWQGGRGGGDSPERRYGVWRHQYAHRIAYELTKGPIPDNLTIDHTCRNTLCVNPTHLEAVTLRVNILRGTAPSAFHAKKTHCPRGHPYAGENLGVNINGQRFCRTCKRARDRAYGARPENKERHRHRNREWARAKRRSRS